MKEYILKGTNERESVDRRISLLTTLLNDANQKCEHISELRQRSLNYALIIFAGVFTFTMKFSTALYSLFVSIVLLSLMTVFCLLDRRFHKYIHGWRKTARMFIEKASTVINDPTQEISFPRYLEEGEKTAEVFAFQPIIFYFLVLGGFGHLVYFIISAITK